MREHTLIVKWRAGLHARRAVDLVKLSNKYQSHIIIKKGETDADAKSIISIMTLEATYKTSITVTAEGADENDAVEAIIKLFDSVDD
jgi:phosphocarrier protein HPr